MRLMELYHGNRHYQVKLREVQGEVLMCDVRFHPMFLQIGETVHLRSLGELYEATVLLRTFDKLYLHVPFGKGDKTIDEQRKYERFTVEREAKLMASLGESLMQSHGLKGIDSAWDGVVKDISFTGAGVWLPQSQLSAVPQKVWLKTQFLQTEFEAGYVVKRAIPQKNGHFIGLQLMQISEPQFQLLSKKILNLQTNDIQREHLHDWMERVGKQD